MWQYLEIPKLTLDQGFQTYNVRRRTLQITDLESSLADINSAGFLKSCNFAPFSEFVSVSLLKWASDDILSQSRFAEVFIAENALKGRGVSFHILSMYTVYKHNRAPALRTNTAY
jgi:hypothetical protein